TYEAKRPLLRNWCSRRYWHLRLPFSHRAQTETAGSGPGTRRDNRQNRTGKLFYLSRTRFNHKTHAGASPEEGQTTRQDKLFCLSQTARASNGILYSTIYF